MATFDLMIPIKRQDDSFSLELKKKKKIVAVSQYFVN